MLDKTTDTQLTEVAGRDLAIGIQLSLTIGQTRSLTLTTGVPLDWSKPQLDEALDKLVALGDRQRAKHDIEQARGLLKNAEQELHMHRQNRVVQETNFEAGFQSSGRKGDWRPTGSQSSILGGLQQNIDNSVERIKKLRSDIAEMEGKCL